MSGLKGRSSSYPGKVTPFRKPRRRSRLPALVKLPRNISIFPLLGTLAIGAFYTLPDQISVEQVSASTSATRIIDGDTLDVRGVRVRIANLDCAERDTAAGQSATRAANKILRAGRVIECGLTGRKSYNREVGRCSIDGEDFGKSMVRGDHCTWWSTSDYVRAWID